MSHTAFDVTLAATGPVTAGGVGNIVGKNEDRGGMNGVAASEYNKQ